MVNYFNNPRTNGLDEIYIQNETNNGNSVHGTDVCALIYAFKPDQEMVGCCGVAITPNETYVQSVGQLLIAVNHTTSLPLNGTIKVVATTLSDPGEVAADGDDCDPSHALVNSIGDVATVAPRSLNAWITHTITLLSPSATFMTEEPFAQTGEPPSDLNNNSGFSLEDQCETVNGQGTPPVCPGSL